MSKEDKLDKILEALEIIRKEENERWSTAPVWAFPYQGRKILLRHEVLQPIAREITEIKDLINKKSTQCIVDLDGIIWRTTTQSPVGNTGLRDITEIIMNIVGTICGFVLIYSCWYLDKK